MKLPVLTPQGQQTERAVALNAHIFGLTPDKHQVWLAVRQQLAAQRQGTHKAKEKSEITASTRKVQKQKGTGNARKGSLKSGILRGGGRFFGPKPRDYSFKINKKQKRLARRCALSHRAQQQQITVVESLALTTPKTKDYLAILKQLGLQEKKTLVILPTDDRNLLLASRNLPMASLTTVSGLNTYQVLHAQQLIFVESALPLLEKQLA